MKSRVIVSGIVAAALVALGSTGCASAQSQTELLAQAKISKETAQQTALAKVPNGTVKDGELEKENGKLQWSFDIAVPDSKDIKEVAVDAITGAVIGVDTETPAAQAKEAAEDAAKENGEAGKQAKLLAKAKVSKETAQATAQAKVPNGTIKEGELEKEKGKLIWSFCFTIPDSQDIKEVNVDAITGDVVGEVETETPADQAKEAAEDAAAAKKKHGGEKEEKD